MNGWMNGWMDGWMDGWMNEWMNGWMDGWMNELKDAIDNKQIGRWLQELNKKKNNI